MKLDRDFYMCSGLELARQLIGKVLVHSSPEGLTAGRIVETEAYMGKEDPAAHSYRGDRNGRTAIQYGPGGFAYIYFIYGMHCCMNVTANTCELPEVVLIRALEPLEGLDIMVRRRNKDNLRALCSGPGKLSKAMAIDRGLYGEDLTGDTLFIRDDGFRNFEIAASGRINVDYAGAASQWPWRMYLKGSEYLSTKV